MNSFVNLHVFFGFLFVFLPLPDERVMAYARTGTVSYYAYYAVPELYSKHLAK